jgi:hypothetical protein
MDLLQKTLETSEQQDEQVHMQAQKSSPSEINASIKVTVYCLAMDVLVSREFSQHPNALYQTQMGSQTKLNALSNRTWSIQGIRTDDPLNEGHWSTKLQIVIAEARICPFQVLVEVASVVRPELILVGNIHDCQTGGVHCWTGPV